MSGLCDLMSKQAAGDQNNGEDGDKDNDHGDDEHNGDGDDDGDDGGSVSFVIDRIGSRNA